MCSVLGVMAYTYYAFDHFHWHLTHLYAHHLDDHHAQHVLGHKLIKDHKNASAAFQWWRKAADAGHAHSAYNLAAGHLSGYRTDVKKGESLSLVFSLSLSNTPIPITQAKFGNCSSKLLSKAWKRRSTCYALCARRNPNIVICDHRRDGGDRSQCGRRRTHSVWLP